MRHWIPEQALPTPPGAHWYPGKDHVPCDALRCPVMPCINLQSPGDRPQPGSVQRLAHPPWKIACQVEASRPPWFPARPHQQPSSGWKPHRTHFQPRLHVAAGCLTSETTSVLTALCGGTTGSLVSFKRPTESSDSSQRKLQKSK